MKRLQYLFIIVLFNGLLTSCEEKFDRIDFTPVPPLQTAVDTTFVQAIKDTTYPQNVLIEDFTGGDCINCPSAHKQIDAIAAPNTDRVFIIAVHSKDGALGKPAEKYPKAKYDFRTDLGTDLSKLFQVTSLPQATINRKLFPLEAVIAVTTRANWKIYTDEEITKRTPASIAVLNKNFSASDSVFTINFNVTFSKDVATNQYVTILVSESNIIDYQATLSGFDSVYNHKHILRKAFYPEAGLKLQVENGIKSGRVFTINAKTKLESGWKPENCHATILVHQKDNGIYEVTQVADIKVK